MHQTIKKVFFAIWPFVFIILMIAALIFIIPTIPIFKQFETVTYTNSKHVRYELDFYKKYSTTKLQSGNTQLVSKVSKDGKLPIAFSIATGEASAYDQLKNCGQYKKLFSVQNDNLKQSIVVCDMQSSQIASNKDYSNTVYIAAFLYKNQTNVITVAQDYSKINTSNQAEMQAATAKFGLQPYQSDIKKIIGSIQEQ
jgi:hypothetical protein